MNVIGIHEHDHDDKEDIVIGVADSVEKADEVIEKYYGKENMTEISFNDIRDSTLQYSKVLEIGTLPYKVAITLEWFTINSI